MNIITRGDNKITLIIYFNGIYYILTLKKGNESIKFIQVNILNIIKCYNPFTLTLKNKIYDFHLINASLNQDLRKENV
jgi:hypothetical protein